MWSSHGIVDTFGHLLRVLLGWGIIIDDTVVPMWPSVLVVVVFFRVSVLICRESV